MLAAADKNNAKTIARYASRGEAYHCIQCGEPVRLHRGEKRVPHFSHMPESSCVCGTGESVAHRRTKESIYLGLRARGIAAEVEHVIGANRADVSIPSRRIVIEVQRSAIDPREAKARVASYGEQGFRVI